MIEAMDPGIGRIDETLADLGLRDDTLVVFTSDNGPYLGEVHGVSLDRFNCGWRGAKHYVYEGGIRVPAIVRWPAGLDAAARRSTRWCTSPTGCRHCAAAAGVALPERVALDGDDMLVGAGGRAGRGPAASASGSGTGMRPRSRATRRCATATGSSSGPPYPS